MRTFSAKRGPFSKQVFFTHDEIEDMCVEELRSIGLLPSEPSPVRIDRFIEKKFGISVNYEELPDGLLGFTRFSSGGVEDIVVAKKLDGEGTIHSERRVRTTIAHEAGHGLLHAHYFVNEKQSKKIFDKEHDETPRVLCRETNHILRGEKGNYRGEWWEYQANMVMGVLLLPRQLVEEVAKPFMKEGGFFSVPEFTEASREKATLAVSNIFNVNPVVAKIRLEGLYPLTSTSQLRL